MSGDDPRFLERLRAGEPRAFEELVIACQHRVFGVHYMVRQLRQLIARERQFWKHQQLRTLVGCRAHKGQVRLHIARDIMGHHRGLSCRN